MTCTCHYCQRLLVFRAQPIPAPPKPKRKKKVAA